MMFGDVVAIVGAVEIFVVAVVMVAMVVGDSPVRIGVEPRAARDERKQDEAREAA